MVAMENDKLATTNDKFVAEGLQAVNISFVDTFESMDTTPTYFPEFVHQHFGENETIFGYENLKVNVYYTDASLYVYHEVKYDSDITKVDKELVPDDIETLLKNQLPINQMDMMVESREAFQAHLIKQKNFKPYGELLSKFTTGDRMLAFYKVSESSPDFDKYLERAQTLALWNIDAAQYTDNSDPRWVHYFLYETNTNSTGTEEFKFAGYASLYRFYAYPAMERPRVAQILLLPQYRRSGNGAKFLQAIYNDLIINKVVLDITAEDPADNFIYLRDYVDCVNCSKLPSFVVDKLKNGYSDEMRKEALEKLKINRKQSRRVYEILKYKSLDKKNEGDMKNYRIEVKRRLEAPMKKCDKEWKRINSALEREEINQVAAAQLDTEQKFQLLQSLYDSEIEAYKVTAERLLIYPTI